MEAPAPATVASKKRGLCEEKDLKNSYYRELINGQDKNEVVSAAQKAWRRGRASEARYWIALLLLSFHCERAINRMITGLLEDVSIANSGLVILGVRVHKRYVELRKACDVADRKAKLGKGVPKSWRQGLRNSIELRSLFGQLVTAICNSQKSRITDHVYSAVYDMRTCDYNNLESLKKRLSESKPSLNKLIKQAMEARGDLKIERQIYERLAIYYGICFYESQTNPKYGYPIAESLIKMFESHTGSLPTEELQDAARGLAYICREVYFEKSLKPGRFPAKLPLTHWVMLFTRPVEQLGFDPLDLEEQECLSEATDRYDQIISGKERIEIPVYALDKHTARGYAMHGNGEVDVTTGGFYRREHFALYPLSKVVVDPYLEEAFANADAADKLTKIGEKKGKSAKKARKSDDDDDADSK